MEVIFPRNVTQPRFLRIKKVFGECTGCSDKDMQSLCLALEVFPCGGLHFSDKLDIQIFVAETDTETLSEYVSLTSP